MFENSPGALVPYPPVRQGADEVLGKVIVGVDGSKASALAVEWCAQLARSTDTHVVAVHALDLNAPKRTIDVVDSWCAALREAGIHYKVVLGEGDPRVILIDVAEYEDAQLIVVGSHGQSTVVQLVLGSVGQYLVHRSERPVAIVHGPDQNAA